MANKNNNTVKPRLNARRIMLVIGILIIIATFFVELLPITSPGIGPLQWSIVIVTLSVILLSYLPFRFNILFSLISIIMTLLLLEFVLFLMGWTALFPGEIASDTEIESLFSDAFVCDDVIGCRFNPDEIEAAFIENPDLPLRFSFVNEQGYADTENFSPETVQGDLRILALGDSFTWGATADIGQSYVELLELNLQSYADTSIWNTGIPAMGTQNALANARYYVPIMEPDLVILGFFGNDFPDNLYPLGNGVRLNLGDQLSFTNTYDIELDGSARPLSRKEIYYLYYGYQYPQNGFQRVLLRTRLGSLLYNTVYNFLNRTQSDNPSQFDITSDLLAELSQFLADNNTPFFILAIPSEESMIDRNENYQIMQEFLENQGIPYYDPIDSLTIDDYAENPNDGHWNNSGHSIVADLLLDCVIWIRENDNIACPGMTLPD